MPKQKKVIFFDIDYVLFNTKRWWEFIDRFLAETLGVDPAEFTPFSRRLNRKITDHWENFNPGAFLSGIKEKYPLKLEKNTFLTSIPFKKFLYPDAEKSLANLKSMDVTLGIFSDGESEFQTMKISPLLKYFDKEKIFIFPSNKAARQVSDFQKPIILVEDKRSILSQIKSRYPKVIDVLIKRGKYYRQEKGIPFRPSFKIDSLEEVALLVKKRLTTRKEAFSTASF